MKWMQIQTLQLTPNSFKIIHRQIWNVKLFKIIEESIEENGQKLGFRHVDHELWILTRNTKRQSTKKTSDTMDFIKLKISALWKTLFRKSKDKSQTGRKMFANTYLIKDLSQNTQRTLTQTTPLKIGNNLNGNLSKDDTQIVYKNMPRTGGQKSNSPAQLPESWVTLD